MISESMERLSGGRAVEDLLMTKLGDCFRLAKFVPNQSIYLWYGFPVLFFAITVPQT